MPTGPPGISSMTPLQDPSLQHLQPGRLPGARPPVAPGAPANQPEGSTLAQTGPQAQQQHRMVLPNGHLPPNATGRPGQMHSNSPQTSSGVSASPQQATTTNLSDIPPNQIMELARQVGAPPHTDINKLPEEIKVS
jgi:hypothetical protein